MGLCANETTMPEDDKTRRPGPCLYVDTKAAEFWSLQTILCSDHSKRLGELVQLYLVVVVKGYRSKQAVEEMPRAESIRISCPELLIVFSCCLPARLA